MKPSAKARANTEPLLGVRAGRRHRSTTPGSGVEVLDSQSIQSDHESQSNQSDDDSQPEQGNQERDAGHLQVPSAERPPKVILVMRKRLMGARYEEEMRNMRRELDAINTRSASGLGEGFKGSWNWRLYGVYGR